MDKATRGDMWEWLHGWMLGGTVAAIATGILMAGTDDPAINALGTLVWVCVLVCMFATFFIVGANRLHDMGWNGWWMLIVFTPLGWLLAIALFFFDSKTDANI